MRSVSKKRARALRRRRIMLERVGFDRRCEARQSVPRVECWGQTDPHEPRTRARGGPIDDPNNLMWLCSAHHQWTHQNQDEAHELGLLKHSWERTA